MGALVGIAGLGSAFQCALVVPPYTSCWSTEFSSTEEHDTLIREETPGRVFLSVLKQYQGNATSGSPGAVPLGLSPTAILWASGPGSYTGLRITCSFVKGLACAYGSPVIAYSFLELAWFLFRTADGAPISLGAPLGRGRFVVATGSSHSDFKPAHWQVLQEVSALKSYQGPFFLLQEDGTVRLQNGRVEKIHFGEALVNYHSWRLESGKEGENVDELAPCGVTPEGLAALAPHYGQSFSALTLEQQRLHQRPSRFVMD